MPCHHGTKHDDGRTVVLGRCERGDGQRGRDEDEQGGEGLHCRESLHTGDLCGRVASDELVGRGSGKVVDKPSAQVLLDPGGISG